MVDVWDPGQDAASKKPGDGNVDPSFQVSPAALKTAARDAATDNGAEPARPGRRAGRRLQPTEAYLVFAAAGVALVCLPLLVAAAFGLLSGGIGGVLLAGVLASSMIAFFALAYVIYVRPLIRSGFQQQAKADADTPEQLLRVRAELHQRQEQLRAVVSDNQTLRNQTKATTHSLRHARAQFVAALRVVDDAVAIVNAQGRIEHVSDALSALTGLTLQSARGRMFDEVMPVALTRDAEDAASGHTPDLFESGTHETDEGDSLADGADRAPDEAEPGEATPDQAESHSDTAAPGYSLMADCLAQASESPSHYQVYINKNGQRSMATLSVRAALSSDGELRGGVALFLPAGHAGSAQSDSGSTSAAALNAATLHRGLNLPGYAQFCTRLDELVRISTRQDQQCAVIIARPDDPPAGSRPGTRDYGFEAYDALLWDMARALENAVGSQGTVYRVGAAHFGVLVPFVDADQARDTGKRLRLAAARVEIDSGEEPLRTSLSLGLVVIDREAPGRDTVIQQAQTALTDARARGGNQLVLFQPDAEVRRTHRSDRRWIEWLLPRLNDDRLRLIVHPLASISERARELPLAEVYVRVEDDDGIWVEPNEFLPAVNRHNLSVRLDLAVVAKVLKVRPAVPGDTQPTYCVNLTRAAMLEAEFSDKLDALLKAADQPPALCLELDEDTAVSDPAAFRAFVLRMQALGVSVGLDRCRASNLAALLRDCPLLYMKIDEAISSGAQNEGLEAAQLEWLSNAAHALDRLAIVTRVSEQAQLDWHQQTSIDYAHGNAAAHIEPLE